MKLSVVRRWRGVFVNLLLLLVALPVAAVADKDYAGALEREAGGTRVTVVAPTARVVGVEPFDPMAVRAAQLGVITPYGKAALVDELRSYYPGAYRSFRALSDSQVRQLVLEFEQHANIVSVLSLMDGMLPE